MSGRLFLAAVPDARTAACIYHLAEVVKRARRFDGKLIEPDCLHKTLFFLDDGRGSRERTVRMTCEAAQQERMPSFEVSFDRIASFRGKPGHHPFALLGDDGLSRLLWRTPDAAMARNGLRHLVTTDFTPHVTLLYDKRKVDEQPIEPIFWRGRRVRAHLIHSMDGHTHLARWPLRVE